MTPTKYPNRLFLLAIVLFGLSACTPQKATVNPKTDTSSSPKDTQAQPNDTGVAANTDGTTDDTSPAGTEQDINTDPVIKSPCAGLSCTNPGNNECGEEDVTTILVRNSIGWCDRGICQYSAHVETCENKVCQEGICTQRPCQGVACVYSPAAECSDANTLKIFNRIGYCTSEAFEPSCQFAHKEMPCEAGCVDNHCAEEDPCARAVCDSPPASYCGDDGNLVIWDTIPRCNDEGKCEYSTQTVQCKNGCDEGHCTGDPKCAKVVCDQPPASHCLDDQTLIAYQPNGTCNEEGGCIYEDEEIACSQGCEEGQCIGEPCAGVFCAQPPAAYCKDSDTLVYWNGKDGGCDEGVCDYTTEEATCPDGCEDGQCVGAPCIGVICNSAPAPACIDENSFDFYRTPGDCNDGFCSYQHMVIGCDTDQRCENGMCLNNSTGDTDSIESDSEEILGNTLIIGSNQEGGSLISPQNTELTFADGSMPAGDTITAQNTATDTVDSSLLVIAGLHLVMNGTATMPPTVSAPNINNLAADTSFYWVQLVEMPDNTIALNPVATARVSEDGENIITNNTEDADRFLTSHGLVREGTYFLIAVNDDTGLVFGQVVDTTGTPVSDLEVQTSGETFCGKTDENGYFAVVDRYGISHLMVWNPITQGYASKSVRVSDTDQQIVLQLTSPNEPPDLSSVGCLDMLPLDAYQIIGDVTAVTELDTINGPKGDGMMLIRPTEDSFGNKTSSLSLTLNVPEGASLLYLEYHYLSDEYPDDMDALDADQFYIVTYNIDGIKLISPQYSSYMETSDTRFAGATSWHNISLPVKRYAGLNSPITLSFVISEVNDARDSAVLIDYLRFDSNECDSGQ